MSGGRLRLLDLFCKAGGAGMGYCRAGFTVTGVDIAPQPRYPFPFVRADACDVLADPGFLTGFDAIHASPPCQGYSRMSGCRPGLAGSYPRLIELVRGRLTAWGGPWVIENVEGSGLAAQDDLLGARGLLLCGTMFGLKLYRHRLFELNTPVTTPDHPRHLIPASRAGHWGPGTVISVAGNCSPIAVAREAMGIDWMTRDELAEAIPPAYTRYIGAALAAAATARRAA
jgi:DNA (cytosine-5)-methyltransferase 1